MRELHIRNGDFELYLSNDANASTINRRDPTPRSVPASGSAPLQQAPAPAQSGVTALPPEAIIIRAPNLGTFYRAPKPGADNYVEVGSTISGGDELCLIEVMKLFTSVQSETAGMVHAVLAVDGEMVEAGQPLFAIVNS